MYLMKIQFNIFLDFSLRYLLFKLMQSLVYSDKILQQSILKVLL